MHDECSPTSHLILLPTETEQTCTSGLDNDEGIPSDDEGEAEEEEKQEEKEEKQDSPEKAKAAPAPFVFGAPAPKLVGPDDPNKTFGFGAPAGADFSFGNVGGTNIFAKKDEGMLINTS